MNYITKEFLRAIKSRWFIASLLMSLGLLFVGLVAFYPLDPSPPPGWHFAHLNRHYTDLCGSVFSHRRGAKNAEETLKNFANSASLR